MSLTNLDPAPFRDRPRRTGTHGLEDGADISLEGESVHETLTTKDKRWKQMTHAKDQARHVCLR